MAGADRLRAIRLLGQQPLGMMDDERVLMIYLACDAMDPRGKSSFFDVTNELHPGEPERMNQWIAARDPKRKAPADAEAGREALLALVSEEEERLEALLARRLESESAAAEARLGFDDTVTAERLRRYQLACHRTLMRILEQLRKRRREREEDASGGTTSQGKPPVAASRSQSRPWPGDGRARLRPSRDAPRLAGRLALPWSRRAHSHPQRTRRTNPTPRPNPRRD